MHWRRSPVLLQALELTNVQLISNSVFSRYQLWLVDGR
jgi:hypothetical protein